PPRNPRTRPHAARRRVRAVVRREPAHQQGDARRHRSDLAPDRLREMRRSHRARLKSAIMVRNLRLLVAASLVALASTMVMAQTSRALAGQTPPAQGGPADPLTPEQTSPVREPRNSPEQPPLIPHSTEGYEVSIHANKCLSCHARTRVRESQAPMISITHFA